MSIGVYEYEEWAIEALTEMVALTEKYLRGELTRAELEAQIERTREFLADEVKFFESL